MLIAAVVLTLGINVDLNLGVLLRKKRVMRPNVTCGVKVVGYHIAGRVGQVFEYDGETFVIPAEGFVEVIAMPRVTHYVVGERKLALDEGALDGFSFRWIELP